MPEPLAGALARLRAEVLEPDVLVRAVLSGRRRGQDPPADRRVEVRWVDLRAGRHLQVVAHDGTQARTSNHAEGEAARAALDALVAAPYGTWHVETTTRTHQLRVTKRLEAQVHTATREVPVSLEPASRRHDREKQRLLAEDDPLLVALGLADAGGRLKPSRVAKYRQVEEMLRQLDAALDDALARGRLRRATAEDPLRVVDLGCGNGYLTFAAQRYLADVRGLPVEVTGVDVKEQARDHHTTVAERTGVEARFVVGTIDDVSLDPAPDVVLALHACDTATDDVLARAVGWDATLVLAAPCCHHDVAAQLRRGETPTPYSALTRHGILRERFADTLTDALRASLLRLEGYRVEVVEFVGSEHTPRNTLLRAVRTATTAGAGDLRAEYDDLVASWGVRPALADRLDARPGPR